MEIESTITYEKMQPVLKHALKIYLIILGFLLLCIGVINLVDILEQETVTIFLIDNLMVGIPTLFYLVFVYVVFKKMKKNIESLKGHPITQKFVFYHDTVEFSDEKNKIVLSYSDIKFEETKYSFTLQVYKKVFFMILKTDLTPAQIDSLKKLNKFKKEEKKKAK